MKKFKKENMEANAAQEEKKKLVEREREREKRVCVCFDHAIAYWPLTPSSHAPTTSSRSGGLGRVEEGEVVSDQTHSADQADPWKDHAQLTKPLPNGINVWPVETSSP